jgi:hypothetical protein
MIQGLFVLNLNIIKYMPFSQNLKQATKEAILEALYEYDEYKRKRVRNIDPDLISTREAYRLRGRSRVTHLIKLGLLKQITTGNNPTSVKYISKKKLLDLDKINV